jgi:hypothetical protein
MYKIVTHPGSAHKDDFMAVSVLLGTLEDAVVLRRDPSRAELDDPDTYVVDVGMEHNPLKHNFDHHHNPALPCAFHLVMQHLNYHEAANLSFAWYPHMSMMDVRGPYRTAQDLGIDSSVLFASSSPIDGYILALFSRHTKLTSKDLLYQFMKAMGQDLIQLIDRKKERLARLKRETAQIELGPYRAIVSHIEDAPKLAIELYLRELDDPRIVMSITPAIRGKGWEMLRLNEHAAVDFLALKDQPAISFIHANGFLAKTRTRLPIDKVLELAKLAIVESEN